MKITQLPTPATFMSSKQQAMPSAAAYSNQTVSQEQTASIFIKTKEGDTISISDNVSSLQNISQYYGDNLNQFAAEFSIKNSSLVQVHGDLNEQELADLGSLLGTLSDIAGEFFNGNLDDAVTDAMNIGDMGSLAQLDATFASNTSLAYDYGRTVSSAPTAYQLPPDAGTELFNDLMSHKAHDHGRSAGKINDAASKDGPLAIDDNLKSQWRQFLDYLEEQGGVDGGEKHKHGHHHRHEGEDDASQTPGQAMLAKAKDTLINHPRLSPLMPALGDLAVGKAASATTDRAGSLHSLANDLRHSFRDAFQSWMV